MFLFEEDFLFLGTFTNLTLGEATTCLTVGDRPISIEVPYSNGRPISN